MGLDIAVYSRLQLVETQCPRPRGFCEDEEAEHIQAFAYADHIRSYEGLAGSENEREFSKLTFIGFRCYVRTDATQTLRVLSMAYGSYNRWRDMLCRAALSVEPEQVWGDLDKFAGRPFMDPINFADNEGCIGPVAAARLHEAFTAAGARERFAEQVERDLKDFPSLIPHHLQPWDRWIEGCALAKDGGLVSFG